MFILPVLKKKKIQYLFKNKKKNKKKFKILLQSMENENLDERKRGREE